MPLRLHFVKLVCLYVDATYGMLPHSSTLIQEILFFTIILSALCRLCTPIALAMCMLPAWAMFDDVYAITLPLCTDSEDNKRQVSDVSFRGISVRICVLVCGCYVSACCHIFVSLPLRILVLPPFCLIQLSYFTAFMTPAWLHC